MQAYTLPWPGTKYNSMAGHRCPHRSSFMPDSVVWPDFRLHTHSGQTFDRFRPTMLHMDLQACRLGASGNRIVQDRSQANTSSDPASAPEQNMRCIFHTLRNKWESYSKLAPALLFSSILLRRINVAALPRASRVTF